MRARNSETRVRCALNTHLCKYILERDVPWVRTCRPVIAVKLSGAL